MVTTRGVCWSTSSGPTIALSTKTSDASGTGSYTSSITGLTANTTFYVRAYATNLSGTAYGNELIFTTSATPVVPSLSTLLATAITPTTTTSGGNVTSDGGANITSRGICYNTSANPTTANSKVTATGTTGAFTSNLSTLEVNTTYHVRAYATNSIGTAYGADVSFYTPNLGNSVTDIDGNTYYSITIGSQVWMFENLKTTKYSDGSAIKLVTDNSAWITAGAAYCWYNNDAATFKATYGALYNWYAIDKASNGGKNICPAGWHVPTDAEWKTLTNNLGGLTMAGGILKTTGTIEAGTGLWHNPNTGAVNSIGFSALPGGHRLSDGVFYWVGEYCGYWSSTEFVAAEAWWMRVFNTNKIADRGYGNKINGVSVRCLKD